MGEAGYSPTGRTREPMKVIGARFIKREARHVSERWLGLKATPAWLAIAAVLLLAAGAFLGQLSAHRRTKAAASQPVKYIHVITPNASCNGLGAAAAAATQGQSQQQPNSSTISTTAVPGIDAAAAFLSSILPLTNFSALTSGQILDAAAAGKVSVQQLQPLMQLHQHMWCSAGYNTVPVPNITSVKFSNVSISIYAGNDIVSNELRGKGRSWEHNEVKEMLWAVRQYWKQDAVMMHLGSRPQQPAAAAVAGTSTPGSGRLLRQYHQQQQQQQQAEKEQHGVGASKQLLSVQKGSRPLMVDVGSNVGWFAINAAAAGARVAAFEAMDSNLALLRRSLCHNQWLAQRIALFGTGLGTEPGACSIVSGEDNKGDGIVVCGQDPQAAIKERGWNTTVYKVRGAITIKRLDTLIQEDIQVMKMDVEGFELHVLKGATDLLQRFNVWYIMLECNKGLLGGQKGQFEYFKYLDEAGYSISTYGFSGPFINPEHIKDGSLRIEAWNLYCVRKDLRQAHLAVKAGVTPPKGKKP